MINLTFIKILDRKIKTDMRGQELHYILAQGNNFAAMVVSLIDGCNNLKTVNKAYVIHGSVTVTVEDGTWYAVQTMKISRVRKYFYMITRL